MNKGEIKLHSNKTGKTRFIPIKKSTDHLNRYREECFATTPRGEDKVFDVDSQAINYFLNKLEKKINFSKHLYPYLWRHSILSRMITKLSPKVYEMYSGHSLETGMKIYAHLDTDNLKQELEEKIWGMEKLTPEDKNEIKELKKEIDKIKEENKNTKTKTISSLKELYQQVDGLHKQLQENNQKIN